MKTDLELLANVRKYNDYRVFLSDFFETKKKLNPSYSHRVFIKKAEMKSPSHLKMIIDGKRNLTGKTLKKYVNAIGFKKRDANFFELLVNYNQEKDHNEKIRLFQELMNERRKKGLSDIEEAQYEFLTKWHYVAIYVMLDLEEFDPSPEWIAGRLKKRISIQNIEKALEQLKKLKLVETCSTKGLKQTNGALDTSDEVLNMAFRGYHKNMAEMAINSLDTEKVQNREFNGVTIPINKSKINQINQIIRNFRKEINEIASNMEEPDEVYQLNIHFFPLTEVRE